VYPEWLRVVVRPGAAVRRYEHPGRLLVRQAQEEQRVAAARLAQTLHLDPAVNLVPSDADLVPLSLPGADADLNALVSQALESRPELKQSSSLVAAAEKTQTAAVYGPIVPTLSGQVFGGGLGGGIIPDVDHFGHSADYFAGLSWRIGPGGLFDIGRIHAHSRGSAVHRSPMRS